MIKSLIKWPGGKSSEIELIKPHIPKFERYVEPFFGGGAMYFYLQPQKAVINDISENLIDFYKFIKNSDDSFKQSMDYYADVWDKMLKESEIGTKKIMDAFPSFRENSITLDEINQLINEQINFLLKEEAFQTNKAILNIDNLKKELYRTVFDKVKRTKNNEIKNNQQLTDVDLFDNIQTGFTGGLYMYFRSVHNDVLKNRIKVSKEMEITNFFFIREYCYGSMFRYNSNGEFNIPYGGISYNNKDLRRKMDNIFDVNISSMFKNTEILNLDFEDAINKSSLTDNDFMFLDPPYDTEFSDYEGKSFDKIDQSRLAEALTRTKAKFILVIKNTDFIYALYKDKFKILSFDKNYTYNVRSRNDRNVKHLLITNI